MITVKGKQYPDFNMDELENLIAKYKMTYPDAPDPMDHIINQGTRGLYYLMLASEDRLIDFNEQWIREGDDLQYVLNVKFVDN